MATEIQRKQNLLSEHLLLLQQLDYRHLRMNYQTELWRVNKNTCKLEATLDFHLLDTVAVALATGSPGEVYAAAFDKNQRLGLVIAKNGSPTEEDRTAAEEFISLIQSPTTNDWEDVFPFLVKRCGRSINHRIEALAASMTETLFQDFSKALEVYEPNVDVQSEFPEGALFRYGDDIPTFTVVWNYYIQDIKKRCKVLDLNPDPSNMSAIRCQFDDLCLSAVTVLRSRFLKWFVNDYRPFGEASRMRAERFKRRLAKCCQYINGIHLLVLKAKRLPPISHEWVTMDLVGSGQGPFSIPSLSAHDAIESILGQPLDEDTQERVTKIFGSKAEAWMKGAKGTARVHAELRIILHFGPPSSPHDSVHAIGVSKRSCMACVLWINAHNRLFWTKWTVSGSHGKPYLDWALPGDACTYQNEDKIDKEMMTGIYQCLMCKVTTHIPSARSILDEQVLGGGQCNLDDDIFDFGYQRFKALAALRV